MMSSFLYPLLLFGCYTLAVILFTGPSFTWNETRRSFYIGSNRTGWFASLATFCATWVSIVSLVGYTVWLYRDGYSAFMGSVNGWLLGLVFMPFLVRRLRASRSLSIPDWLATTYRDSRLRPLGGAVLLLTYLFYLVIQFEGVDAVVGHMLGIPHGSVSIFLIFLFVLYTTLGGYASVVRSDVLNLLFILVGVTVPAAYLLRVVGGLEQIHLDLSFAAPEMLSGGTSLSSAVSTFTMMLAWGLGIAVNPQYTTRIMAARRRRDAYWMLCLAPFILGWVYFSVTLIGLGVRVLSPQIGLVEDVNFPALLAGVLPPTVNMFFLIAALAAAVSTANSQLLLAAGSLCNDLWPFLSRTTGKKRTQDPMHEEHFLFVNRLVVAVLLLIAMCLAQLEMPGMLLIGRYSWTVIAVCFTAPLLLPRWMPQKGLFECLVGSLLFHIATMALFSLPPERALLSTLVLQLFLLFFCRWKYVQDKEFVL